MIAHGAAAAEQIVEAARPLGVASDWRTGTATSHRAVWARRGEVFAVHAPGNHPATHAAWLQALALGYRVAVRPSTRDPFTPHRLVTALRACGFSTDQVALLPTTHGTADDVIRSIRPGTGIRWR
jgi:acyl-CoA reductase-like NAD-dependent aldehyde dehydrogenase